MNHVRRRSGLIGIVYWTGLFFLVAALSWSGLAYIITHAEGVLSERVAADVIVPLAGAPDRAAYARTLLRRQTAPNIASTLVDTRCLRTHGPNPVCATRVRNTIDEAIVLRRIFEEERFTSAIVVTSRYHLARAAAVFTIIFAGSGIDVHFVATPEAHLIRAQVSREVKTYLPSLAGAVLARFVPSMYEWTVRNRPVCPDSVTLASE